MKTETYVIRRLNLMLGILTIILLVGCAHGVSSRMSEYISGNTVGRNGSFEITKSGLPVNWILYTPKTIPTEDYDLIIDTTEYKDGRQSLKFPVIECSPNGGWHSPGFCMQYKAEPGESYLVSFWVKNE
jgi:hypothetical protein